MKKPGRPLSDVRWLRLKIQESNASLWIRISMLRSANGFRNGAEVTALFTHRAENGETSRVLVRQPHDYREVDDDTASTGALRIGTTCFANSRWNGIAQSGGKTIEWDLRETASGQGPIFLIRPQVRPLLGHAIHSEVTAPDLTLSGTLRVGDRRYRVADVPASTGRIFGSRSLRRSIFIGCSRMTGGGAEDDSPFFYLQSLEPRLAGFVPFRKLVSCCLRYEGKIYRLNKLWDLLRARVKPGITRSEFRFEKKSLAFQIQVDSKLKDFSGLRYENTNGTLLYAADSENCDLQVLVYRKGKLEATLRSEGGASMEIISPEKNPYVTVLG